MTDVAVKAGGLGELGRLFTARNIDMRWACLAVGFMGSLFAVGGRWDIPLAAWVAPIFLLRFVRSGEKKLVIPVIWLVSLLNSLFWAFELNQGPLGPPEYTIAVVFGLVFAFPFAIDRVLTSRLGMVGKLAVFPAAWVVTEFLVGTFSPMGVMYGLRANTQTEYLSLLQITALLGPYSIGFLIAWLATTVNWVWEHPNDERGRRVMASFAVALTLVVVGGSLRLAFATPPKTYVRMAAVTPDMHVQQAARAMIEGRADNGRNDGSIADPFSAIHANNSMFASKAEVAARPAAVTRAAYAIVLDNLLATTRAAAHSGAKVVVWSETAAPLLSDADVPAFLDRVGQVAREERIFILAATGQPFARNEAFLVGPDGRRIWSYDKRHPVPLLEPVPPGRLPAAAANTSIARLASVICFDADFPSQARVDADIMMVPGFEFPNIGPTHTLKWVRVRTIENGYSLIRAAYYSQSAAFDRLGHVLATQDTTGPDSHIMYADVPTKGSRTLYSRTGDVLAWLCAAGLLVAVAAALRSKSGSKSPPRSA